MFVSLPENLHYFVLIRKNGLLSGKTSSLCFRYSYPTSFGQVPVLVIFVLKCSLLKSYNLLLHLKKCLSILE